MRERPILFSGPMVRAILEGRKTQTRRIIKPQPELTRDEAIARYGPGGHFPLEVGFDGVKCPYGVPGDRLWVRESFHVWGPPDVFQAVDYRATCPDADELKWKPSIHMPRAYSRITLEITDVRVEPLQSISEEDAIAEGIERTGGGRYWLGYDTHEVKGTRKVHGAPVPAFRSLWDSINATRAPWESNPWVWVVGFKRVETPS